MAFFRPILSNDALLDASQLRTALRGAGVNTRRWTESVKLNLTVVEMRDLYHRLRQENLAEQEIAVWARGRICGSVQPSVPSRCIAFWHCVAKRVGESRKVMLPESFQIGLTSATRYFNHVGLICYRPPTNVPQAVIIIDASEYMPLRTAVAVLRQELVTVQQLSDYIRALRCKEAGGGWIVDGDTLWHGVPESFGQYSYGHLFASMSAHTTTRRTASADLKYWETQFLTVPQVRAYVATPFALPAGSPVLSMFIEQATPFPHGLASSTAMNLNRYNRFMRLWKSVVLASGLAGAIVDARECSPIPCPAFYLQFCFFIDVVPELHCLASSVRSVS